MKTKKTMLKLTGLVALVMVFGFVSCSEGEVGGEGFYPADKDGGGYELSGDFSGFADGESSGIGGGLGEGETSENGNTSAGIVTAGEWCDLTHWAFWSGLMQGADSVSFADKSDYWKFYTNNRIAVRVLDVQQRDPRKERQNERNQHDREERMDLQLRDQQDHRGDRYDERNDKPYTGHNKNPLLYIY